MTAALFAHQNDALQKLLGPIQASDPEEFEDNYGPEAPSLDETLEWQPDGLPSWWPLHRYVEGEKPWNPQERRQVLLRNLKETLPRDFPAQPKMSSDKQKLVDSLRHIHGGLSLSAQVILSSS